MTALSAPFDFVADVLHPEMAASRIRARPVAILFMGYFLSTGYTILSIIYTPSSE
jgi:hypothetical protein